MELDYRNGMLELCLPDSPENKTAMAGVSGVMECGMNGMLELWIIGVMECWMKGVLMCSLFNSFRGFRGFRGRFKKKLFSGEIN